MESKIDREAALTNISSSINCVTLLAKPDLTYPLSDSIVEAGSNITNGFSLDIK